MNPRWSALAGRLLRATRLDRWPVRVRRGFAAGARWSLYPYSSYWRGDHEPATQAALAALGGGRIEGWCCWDLGAHFGLYSVGLARRVGPGGEVAAFEPNPENFARLELHRRRNRLAWLKPFNVAVSDRTGSADLLGTGLFASTTAHLAYEGEVAAAGSASHRVAIVRADDLVAAGTLRPPHFIKIDVEGHAHRALLGMQATLSAHRPILIIGCHSPQEADGMLAVLGPLGYGWREIGAVAGVKNPPLRSGGDYWFEPA